MMIQIDCNYRVSQKTNQIEKNHVGLNFTMDRTWERLILLIPSKKRPKKDFLDPRDASHWLMSLSTMTPAAFH